MLMLILLLTQVREVLALRTRETNNKDGNLVARKCRINVEPEIIVYNHISHSSQKKKSIFQSQVIK